MDNYNVAIGYLENIYVVLKDINGLNKEIKTNHHNTDIVNSKSSTKAQDKVKGTKSKLSNIGLKNELAILLQEYNEVYNDYSTFINSTQLDDKSLQDINRLQDGYTIVI